jgi:hypothetical protein
VVKAQESAEVIAQKYDFFKNFLITMQKF